MAGDGAQLPEDDSQARGAQDRWGPTPPPLSRPGQPVGGLEGSCELGPAVKLRQ